MANTSDSSTAQRSSLGVVKALFTHHVALRRDGSRIKVVLESGKKPATAPAISEVAPADPRSARMHADLCALLDEAQGSRLVLKQIAGIERKLLRHGSLVIHDLPAAILRPALRQLDGLAVPPLTSGIVELRNLLADSLALHDRLEQQEALNQPISSFLVDHKLEVKEASATDFDRAALAEPSPQRAGGLG